MSEVRLWVPQANESLGFGIFVMAINVERSLARVLPFLNALEEQALYRGASLIRNSAPLAPYGRNMPRAL